MDAQTIRIFLCQFCHSAMAVSVGQQDVEIVRLKLGPFQELLHQLQHPMSEYRADDTDAVRPVHLILIVDRLGDADRLGFYFFGHIKAVSSGCQIKYHVDHSFMFRVLPCCSQPLNLPY